MTLLPSALQKSQASDLSIAGITPLSTVDWPGKLVATVFTQGCPWRCHYCYNHTIIDPRIPGVVDWSALSELMARRRGLLDGVVFSGGEATRQWALFPAAEDVRSWGFEVGLHTAGPYPSRLRSLLYEGVLDWVGLDIKALPGIAYDTLAGRPNAGEKAWESLDILLESQVDYEVRLTLDSSGLKEAVAVAQQCFARGVRHFVLQEVRTQGVPENVVRSLGGLALESGVLGSIWEEISSIGFDTCVLRVAQ